MKDVRHWRGLHLLHAPMSSCSAKVRIALGIKKIVWCSHGIDLSAGENRTPWFLGVNPGGLVPVLVNDGEVLAESNDILLRLEELRPSPCLVPAEAREGVLQLLSQESERNLDRGTLSLRFIFDRPPRQIFGPGDLPQGEIVQHTSDDAVRAAVGNYRQAFNALDDRLSKGLWLAATVLSLADIAWFVHVDRLATAGYPLRRLHPGLSRWYAGLMGCPDFATEVSLRPEFRDIAERAKAKQIAEGRTLEALCGF